VSFITRQKGSRRYDLPAEFPLVDSNGVLILEDRRQTADRRLPIHDHNDLKTILLKYFAEQQKDYF
jgi:hypothetical protein